MKKSGGLPKISFVVWAFNQETFVRAALEAALAQDYPNLELVFSDDCSTDATFEVMAEVARAYRGPHEVVLNCNRENLGLRGIGLHVNAIMGLASGSLVILAGGDDISISTRASVLHDAWAQAGYPEGCLYSAVELFDRIGASRGVVGGFAEFAQQSIRQCVRLGAKGVLGATLAVTPGLFVRFGPLPDGTLFEDRALAFRSLLAGQVIYSPQPLVHYRHHGDNLSGIENYSSPARWSRWINGVGASFLGFSTDYKTFSKDTGQPVDPGVLKEIDAGLQRARRCRPLVSAQWWKRLTAAWFFSEDFPLRSRLGFIRSITLGRDPRG
ncbi:MAG: glycosyltransferase [Pseudomonadota bacterium]